MKLLKFTEYKNELLIKEDMNKTKKFLKDRLVLTTAAEELGLIKGELEQKLKHKEIRSVKLSDFSPTDKALIKKKSHDIKIPQETIDRISRDSEIQSIRSLTTTINIGNNKKTYTLDKDNFGWLYMFVYLYYNENLTLDELSVLYGRLLTNKEYLSQLPIKIEDDIKLVPFDLSFINDEIPNNSELLTDALDRLDIKRKVKKVVELCNSRRINKVNK